MAPEWIGRTLAGALLDGGAWFKLRHAVPRPMPMLRALRGRRAPAARAAQAQSIVVVGLGAAARACLRELKRAGFANVTVVAKDVLFGGKCVNAGCMPSEFVLAHAALDPAEQRARLAAFTEELRGDVAREFDALGYNVVAGEAAGVRGGALLLRDGTSVDFDRLVVATGSFYPEPRRLAPGAGARVTIEDLWQLPPGTRLAILADTNIAALSLGYVAKCLGLVPTVLLSGANPAARLPSYRYFLRRLGEAGVAVMQDTRLIKVDAASIAYEAGRAAHSLAYDRLLVAGRPAPRMLEIDGAMPEVYDLDLNTGSLPARPDIVFIGDAAGFFTASEAEQQARMVARGWITGARVALAALACMPLSLDGPAPLAMRGPPWMFARRDWAEIDFRALGWSRVRGEAGKLWYLLDEGAGLVEAIHICHPDAKALIALAGLLMDHPVTDDRWTMNTIHPSGAEIFAVLADHARQRLAPAAAPPADGPEAAVFELPELGDMSPAGKLPDWLSADEAVAALASRDPRRHLAACFAVARLGGAAAAIEEDQGAQVYTVAREGRRVSVRY